MFLLLVCLQLCSSHRLLADVTERYVPPTVDLMCGEVGFRNVVLAKEEKRFRVIVLGSDTMTFCFRSPLPVAAYLGSFVAHHQLHLNTSTACS